MYRFERKTHFCFRDTRTQISEQVNKYIKTVLSIFSPTIIPSRTNFHFEIETHRVLK